MKEQMPLDVSKTYIDYLLKALSRKNSKSKEVIDKYRKVYANNRHVAGFSEDWKEMIYTLMVDKADGAYVQDIDNNRYLDITMGFGVHLFGHKPENIHNAIKSEMEKGVPLGPLTLLSAEVAELIHELTSVERCAFFNSGTEAVMVALRLARAETGRDKVVVFSGAYHGTYDSVLVFKKDASTHQALPLIPGITENALKDIYYLNYGTEESLQFIAANATTIAAVLTEPVQSRNPSLQPLQYLQQLRKLTEENGIVLIFDEVITGFRIAQGGAQEYFGIKADIVTYGKVMGGGMPVGVVAGKRKYLDFIDGGQWRFGDDSKPMNKTTFVAGTFCHHPLAMAAAKEALLTIRNSGKTLYEDLNNKTRDLCNELNTYFREHNMPIEMVYFSSLFRFQLKGFARLLYYQLLLEGVYIWEGRNCFLSTAHTESDIKFLIGAVKKSCNMLAASGILKPGQGRKKQSMSNAQLKVWNNYTAPVNILTAVIDLEGNFDFNAFCLAIKSVVQRHDILKSIDVENDHLVLLANYEPVIHSRNFTNENNVEALVLKWNNEYRNTIFSNHQNNTFYFFSIAQIGVNKFKVILNVHKLIMDGWSMIVKLQEISAFYNAYTRKEPIKICEPETFGQYINKHQSPNKLSEFPAIKFYPAKVKERVVEEKLSEALKNTAKIKGKSLFIILSSLLIKVIDSKTEEPLEIGVPVSGQLLRRKIGVIGPCTQIIPVKMTSLSDKTIDEVLSEFDVKLNESIKDFDNYYHLEKENRATIVINLDKVKESFKFYGLKQKVSIPEENFTSYNMVWNILGKGSSMDVSLKYNADKLSEEEATRLLDIYLQELENFISMENELKVVS